MKIEEFNRAKQIMTDLEIINEFAIPTGLSSNCLHDFENWIEEEQERLRKEFEEL